MPHSEKRRGDAGIFYTKIVTFVSDPISQIANYSVDVQRKIASFKPIGRLTEEERSVYHDMIEAFKRNGYEVTSQPAILNASTES